jgi:hypothetical protein
MDAICSKDIVKELLNKKKKKTCIYQFHVTPAANKVLILTVNPVNP